MIADVAAARRTLGDDVACPEHLALVSTVAWAPGWVRMRVWWVLVYGCGCARVRGDDDRHGHPRSLPA